MDNHTTQKISEMKEHFDEAEQYFQRNDFINAAEYYNKAAEIAMDIQYFLDAGWYFAESGGCYSKMLDYANAELEYRQAGNAFKEIDQLEAAIYYSKAADSILFSPSKEKRCGKAAEYYFTASKLFPKDKEGEKFSAISKACINFANDGKTDNCRKTCKYFLDQMKREDNFEDSIEFHINGIIKALDLNGFDTLASDMHICKMRKKTKNFKPNKSVIIKKNRLLNYIKFPISKFFLWFWGITSHFGENIFRFAGCTSLVILLFAIIFLPCPFEEPPNWWLLLEFNQTNEFGPNFAHNFLTALNFSITVFSTLGFGNITPANSLANILVSLEVLWGYAFLGIFITLIGRKALRKNY